MKRILVVLILLIALVGLLAPPADASLGCAHENHKHTSYSPDRLVFYYGHYYQQAPYEHHHVYDLYDWVNGGWKFNRTVVNENCLTLPAR